MLSDSQKWLLLTLLLVTVALLYLLAPVLTPFLIAALLAYLGDPLVDRLEAWKLTRTWAVIVVFVAMFATLVALALLLVPIIEAQLVGLISTVPKYIDWIQANIIPWLQERLGIESLYLDANKLRQAVAAHWQQAGGVAATIADYVSRSGAVLAAWLANLVLVPVVTFYLLRDWDVLVASVHDLLPRSVEPTVARLAKESDEKLGAFLRGQLSVMAALGVIYSIGLWIAGVEFALLIGMLAGLVSFVPYLGVIVGVVVAGIAVLFQTHDLIQLIPVIIVFAVGQALEGMVLTPLLVGDRVGLHPVAVIFAVLAGGQLFGFFGVLLALPVASVLAVWVRYAQQRYRSSSLYGEQIAESAGEG